MVRSPTIAALEFDGIQIDALMAEAMWPFTQLQCQEETVSTVLVLLNSEAVGVDQIEILASTMIIQEVKSILVQAKIRMDLFAASPLQHP